MEQIALQDTDGFLSDKYSITVDKIKTSYKEWFSLAQKINCLIYDMYTNFDLKNNDTIGMYLLSSFSQVHKSFQACSILYSYGLEDNVCIIFRTMLESLFVASSIKKDSNNFNKLIKNQEVYSICISPSADNLCFILTETVGLMLAYIDIVKDYLIKDYTIELNNLKLLHKQLQSRNK